MLSRRTLLLKPMQTAVSGYARLQKENGEILVQLHARNLPSGEARLFVCTHSHAVREVARVQVNAHGEASMEAEAPADLESLLLLGMPPKPLLIGLCGAQDAGSLLDAKNTALSLCERLAPTPRPAAPASAPPTPAVRPVTHSRPKAETKPVPSLPREIFLPAIDPAPYMAASAKEHEESLLPPPRPSGPPADRLRPLRWPRGFASLKPYFESGMPQRLFDLPGWRFVRAADGLCIGIRAQDGRVQNVAYAYAGDAPSGMQQRCHSLRGLDGRTYQTVLMEV